MKVKLRTTLTFFCLIGTLASTSVVKAVEAAPWSHESEASIVKVSGNTDTESYSAKQKTAYKFDMNTISSGARYLLSKTVGTETARSWDANLRYERALSDQWSVFIQHGAESDAAGGYVQRDNTDLGGKYSFIKTAEEALFSEAGVRQTKTISSPSGASDSNMSGRFYSEYSKKFTDTVTGRFWFEYLPNFKDSNAWLLNYEPSVSVMISQMLSLKISYLVKHHEKTIKPDEKKDDSTLTTSLVAKF